MGDQMWDNHQVMNLVVKHNGLLLSDSRVGKNVRGDSSIVLSAITQNSSIINEIYVHNNFDSFMDIKLFKSDGYMPNFLNTKACF